MARPSIALALAALLVSGPAPAQTPARPPAAEEPPPIDHPTLKRLLAVRPSGPEADKLADKIRRWFGAEGIKNGTVKLEGQEVAFAVDAGPEAKSVVAQSADNFLHQKLDPVGQTGLWAAVTTLSDGVAARFTYDIDGRRVGLFDVETYTPHPDALVQPGVPRGKVIQQKNWKSRVFAGTSRDWWIYLPAQYRGKPAAVMVFQDGGRQYLKQMPIVFDNLIHKGDMPITVGVFINPGVFADGRANRSVEYDTLNGDYARFIVDEILPEVEKTAHLRKDPESRAIAGLSSGGICAFTVAWERPDQFRKVMSWVGSFTNIAAGPSHRDGGHNYPALIRKLPRKPIRVFLQDGEQDLDHEAGSWPLANRQMERALAWASYDFRIAWGRGFHSPRHGYAIAPDALRWLWRDHKLPPPPPTATALK